MRTITCWHWRKRVLTTSADAFGRPSLRFVISHPAHFLAFGFGIGLIPVAPGTFGTLAAFPLHAYLRPLLGERNFDVLLTDIGLAGASGVDLAIDAAARQPGMRVIFVTGSDAVLSPQEQTQLQNVAQLRKPYDPLDLVNALRACVE